MRGHEVTRLIDYVCYVGLGAAEEGQLAEPDCSSPPAARILQRYPQTDHPDFPLPTNLSSFCQPDGCSVVEQDRSSLSPETFVFTLTDKDSNVTRYAVCHNFLRLVRTEPSNHEYSRMEDTLSDDEDERDSSSVCQKFCLTSICVISHFQFFSNFKECAVNLRRLIHGCNRLLTPKSLRRHYDAWTMLESKQLEHSPPRGARAMMRRLQLVEHWIHKLLEVPLPERGASRLELELVPGSVLAFALPDKDRLALCDFPLHLPLELLGVSKCLQVLTLIMLERKVVLQSNDYSALSFCILSLTRLLYPLEYVFPIIPLLPPALNGAEQLLLVPTPFIIGVPSSFFSTKRNVKLPSDVWLVDLDKPHIQPPRDKEELPGLPDSDCKILKSYLKQVLSSISIQPIQNFEEMSAETLSRLAEQQQQLELDSPTSRPSFHPFVFGNDTDSVDVATRVAMVKFFCSASLFANFEQHTRTLRLYPRPIVSIQMQSFLNSRSKSSAFINELAGTQAVECFAEWSLTPSNIAFRRILEGVCDPVMIGDKPRWFAHRLLPVRHRLCEEDSKLLQLLQLQDDLATEDAELSDESDPSRPSSSLSSEEDKAASETSFPSDVSVAGSDMTSASEPRMNVCLASSRGPKPPTPTVTPRCSSPLSNMFRQDSETLDIGHEATNEDLSAQEIFFNIEQLTQQAKESFDFARVNSIKTSAVSLGNVGKSVVSNFATSSKKLEFFKALAGSTQSKNDDKVEPVKPMKNGHVNSKLESYSSQADISSFVDSIPPLAKPEPEPESKSTELESPQAKRPLTPNFDITYPKSNLGEIASPRPTSRLPHRASKTETPASPSISMPDTEMANSFKASKIETTTSRFLAEHHPHLTRSDSLLSTASTTYSTQDLFSSISSDLSGLATQTSSLLEGMFGYSTSNGLIASSQSKGEVSAESHFVIKEAVDRVLLGDGIGWLKLNRMKKLMEDEAHRSLLLNYLQRKFGQHLTRDGHIEDLCLGRPVWKGVTRLLSSVIHGLELSYLGGNGSASGVASAFQLLELIHTHYWSPAENMGISHATSPMVGSMDHRHSDLERMGSNESAGSSTLHDNAFETESETETGSIAVAPVAFRNQASKSSSTAAAARRSVMSEGEIDNMVSLYSTVDRHVPKKSCLSGGHRFRGGSLEPVVAADLMWADKSYLFESFVPASFVKTQEPRSVGVHNPSSLWQDMQFWEDLFCDTVAQERRLIGMDSGAEELLFRYRSLAENEKRVLENDEDRLLSVILYNLAAFMILMQVKKTMIKQKIQRLMGKCHLGLVHSVEVNNLLSSLDFLEANDVDLKPLPSRQMCRRTFTVHGGTDTSGPVLFMEVREDGLIIRSSNGMILERWFYDEMVNMTFSPRNKVLCLWRRAGSFTELKKYHTKKCRDLYYCIKDAMESAAARGPVSSVDSGSHAGTPTSSSRRRSEHSSRRNSSNSSIAQLLEPMNAGPKRPLDVGGDYPVEDLATNEGCLLQVCMEGISLLFPKREEFIRLAHIRKCFTQRSSIFVVEEYHTGSRDVVQRKFATKLADQICYSVLCVFSYVAVGQSNRQRAQTKLMAKKNAKRAMRTQSSSSVPLT